MHREAPNVIRRGSIPGHARRLLSPKGFVTSIAAELVFHREHAFPGGMRLSHHLNGPGGYNVDSVAEHAIAVQWNGTNLYRARLERDRFAGGAEPGFSWVKPAGTRIAWGWDEPAEVVNIWIPHALWSATLAAADQPGAGGLALLGRFPEADPVVQRVAHALMEEALGDEAFGRLRSDGLAQYLVAHLARSSSSRRAPPPTARGGLATWQERRTTEHMQAHLADDVALDDLAGIAGLSTFHFARQFKLSTGLPPHRYLRRLRAARARELLATSDLSVADISVAVGYETPQAFARMFRAEVGASPSDYRRKRRL